MAKSNIRTKVLVPLSLTLLVLIAAFVWSSYGIRRTNERLMLQQHFWSAQKVLGGLLNVQIGEMASTIEFIAAQKQMQHAVIHRDREALYLYSKPLLERLSRRLNITHFYYYDLRGNLLIRVYRPEDHNHPRVRRKTLLTAIDSGRPASGLELGRSGTLVQRLVYPWYRGNALIGYIEMGKDYKYTLEKLKEITRVDLVVAIDKTNINRDRWEAYNKKRAITADWNFIANQVVNNTTINLPREVAQSIFSSREYGILDNSKMITIGEKHFRGTLLPATDVSERRIGNLAMLVDVTSQVNAFNVFLYWVVGFSLCLSAAMFTFAFRFLGRTGKQLDKSEDLLRLESANLGKANSQLMTEITVRSQAQDELRNLNHTLGLRVFERTSELEKKNSLLEEQRIALGNALHELKEKQAAILHQDKMACIGQLAAGIAHDINNPVGFISHNLTLFERYLMRLEQFLALQGKLVKSLATNEMQLGWHKAWSDFKVKEVFEEIPVMLGECQDGTTRITQIVQGLRTFMRSETPHQELTDLQKCLDSSLMLLRHEYRNKIRVVKDYQPIPQRHCYPQQMNQLFMNLLINACQAIAGTGEILIRTWSEDQQIFIVISDTGCGIPQEILEKIYEPFFTTKPIGVGTGLGLSIVYDVVTRHHGTLAVESVVGSGTTFTLCFPCDSRKVLRNTPVAVTAEAIPGDPYD